MKVAHTVGGGDTAPNRHPRSWPGGRPGRRASAAPGSIAAVPARTRPSRQTPRPRRHRSPQSSRSARRQPARRSGAGDAPSRSAKHELAGSSARMADERHAPGSRSVRHRPDTRPSRSAEPCTSPLARESRVRCSPERKRPRSACERRTLRTRAGSAAARVGIGGAQLRSGPRPLRQHGSREFEDGLEVDIAQRRGELRPRVGVQRELRLEPDEVLDRGEGPDVRPSKEELPRERHAVERPVGQDVDAHRADSGRERLRPLTQLDKWSEVVYSGSKWEIYLDLNHVLRRIRTHHRR